MSDNKKSMKRTNCLECGWKERLSDEEKSKLRGPKVLVSAHAPYIGYEYYDNEIECWFPYSRDSLYFNSVEEAQKYLDSHPEEF